MIRARFDSRLFFSAILLSIACRVAAAEPIGPDPALAPQDVVSIQLTALQHNDVPTANAGIAQTYALAHPDNQRVTGPLPRFEQMIRSPAYRPLIGHAAHQIERLGGTEATVLFGVTIETATGDILKYLWEVGRVVEGSHKDAWLTTRVSAPAGAGQVL